MNAQRIITIATATGALAEETGRLVARQLSLPYVNEQIIDQAAQQAGVPREEIDRVEHEEPVLARVMTLLAKMSTPRVAEWTWDPNLVYQVPSPGYRRLIQNVIEQVAAAGDAVIVAHGASMRLAGRAGLLRVFVTASPAVRAERIAAERSCSPDEATVIVQLADKERETYLRRFYSIRRELPTHYDLVVNTDRLTAEGAARIIALASGQVPAQRL